MIERRQRNVKAAGDELILLIYFQWLFTPHLPSQAWIKPGMMPAIKILPIRMMNRAGHIGTRMAPSPSNSLVVQAWMEGSILPQDTIKKRNAQQVAEDFQHALRQRLQPGYLTA